jgi:DNA-binding PadR family transcriptional regulator
VADKLTHQILEALTRAAAEPSGLPLYASKSDPGLFPNTASAKPAAQKCVAEELIRVVSWDARPKTPRDLYGLTEKGWEFLLAAVNPKQVLEDFVRVLETRQGEVGELLASARRMADSLQGLKEAVTRVLPVVEATRLPTTPNRLSVDRSPVVAPAPAASRNGTFEGLAAAVAVSAHRGSSAAVATSPEPPGPAQPVGVSARGVPATAALTNSWTARIQAYLREHTGPTDCTLPELYRALVAHSPAPSIGEFHDCLRQLYADGALALHSWTGPLYAIPEPQYALLVGHGIAYYASLKG